MPRTANPELVSSSGSSVSPWLASIAAELNPKETTQWGERELLLGRLQVVHSRTSLWAKLSFGEGALALRLAYSPVGLEVVKRPDDDEVLGEYHLRAPCGDMTVELRQPVADVPLIRWRVTITPHESLVFPFWPRDLIPVYPDGQPMDTKGMIFARQRAPKTPMVFGKIVKPKCGSFLYMQDLTSLNDYCEQAHVRPYGCVGGSWPELGMLLPEGEKPLKKGKPVVISDAILRISDAQPQDHQQAAALFLEMMADVYLQIHRPATQYHDWIARAEDSLRDLDEDPGCTTMRRGLRYFNAYYKSGKRPPESMVQLAVLVPMIDYARHYERDLPLTREIRANLGSFLNPTVCSMVRYLPGDDFSSGKEEQEGHDIMDSWYLYHTLQNAGRMAAAGDEDIKRLFMESLPFAMDVARRFKYHWPIFYNIHTKEAIKKETEAGYGETDVAGLYASVMLQAYQFTQEKQYLKEAQRAADTLQEYGFQLAYQFNSTIYAALALARLWEITGKELYRKLSFVCMANMIANVWLWECTYGHGEAYPTFFGLPPLQDNEYIAVYEEMESVAAMATYMNLMGDNCPASLKMLLPEYSKYVLHRSWYCYPSELPKSSIAEKPKDGELNRKVMIPLEDMGDGFYQHGTVGQEVYGAGAGLLYASWAYHKVKSGGFQVFSEYLVSRYEEDQRRRTVKMTLHGDPRLRAKLRLVPMNGRLPAITVKGEGRKAEAIAGRKDGREIEYDVPGGQSLVITW